jgi:predicted AlkP superfamily pyrophosphatase or phosphodiesterase
MRSSRRTLVITALAAAVVAGLVHASRAQVAGPERPRLVLVLSVDQMREDYLARFRPVFTGGFKTLLDHGAVFTNARYRHACTATGPGHSVILTGRSPRSSGIVGNDWYDRALRRRVNVVEDPTVRVVGGRGRTASPANLVGFTVGDLLKVLSPASRVVGLSLKDRAAILLAGKRADGAYWYEDDGGRFVTSSHYAPTAPAWLDAWNARHLPDSFAGRTWERLLPDTQIYRRLAGEDDVHGESDGKDTVFPHRIGAMPPAAEFYANLRHTPFGDEIVLDAALAAMDGHDLGTDEATDLLGVSFSATDGIGHAYGPDSQELMDQLLRLDRTLSRLLAEVDRRVGPGRTLVVLAADHGAMPLVEVAVARGIDARRASSEELARSVEAALAARFPGATGLVADADPPDYVLDDEAIRRQGIERTDVEQTITKALLGTGIVEAVYTRTQLVGEPPAGDPFFSLHERAFYAPRSPDLVGRTKAYVYVGGYVGGTGHGTPHEYDRHVPIVFMGAGIPAGVREVPCGPEDIAWALGRLLGLDYPQQDAAADLLPLLHSAPAPARTSPAPSSIRTPGRGAVSRAGP